MFFNSTLRDMSFLISLFLLQKGRERERERDLELTGHATQLIVDNYFFIMSHTYDNCNNNENNDVGKKEDGGGESRIRWSEKKAVVVAVKNDSKASRQALKWAIDCFVSREKNRRTRLVLVHVRLQCPTFSISDPLDLSMSNN